MTLLDIIDIRGTGHPFLLLHGGAGPRSVLPFAEHLATTRPARVLTPTIPGYNGSPRPDGLDTIAGLASTWLDLLEEEDLRDVAVVGNSIGGWTAAEMLTHPRATGRISSAVLLNAVGILTPEHPIRDVSGLTLPQIAEFSYAEPERFRIDPASLPPQQQAQMKTNAETLAQYAGTPYMHDPTLRARLAAVTTPVHVIWGAADRIVTAGYGRAYAAAIPGAAFTQLDGAGHLPQMEQPDTTRDLVWDWADAHAVARP
ncbi:alpha/beta hydrolase [Streptomyces sp. NPDC048484]|uniref:alpha/beta fold hydrolase n=1 Tax=Streptomyces sp. NPDC048484 TaxID=3155146 RepID=UPI00341B3F21